MRFQTVAAHSWGVAMMIQRIWPDCRKELILAALQHDLGEQEVGDIPAPAKWRSPDAYKAFALAEDNARNDMGFKDYEKTLTSFELLVLKIADGMELMALSQNRLNNGELGARIVLNNIGRHLRNQLNDYQVELSGNAAIHFRIISLMTEIQEWSHYLTSEEMQEPR
jgi:5'-deoxynucleotidase YfbR-like HD superfamily hydrolase